MVENKRSIYDAVPTDETTPFAEVTAASNNDNDYASPVMTIEATRVEPASNNDTTDEIPDMSQLPDAGVQGAESCSPRTGAGVASGVVGFLVGGPVLAILLGCGAAYAHDKPGVAGDTARAVGEIAVNIRNKANEIDHRHHVVQKSQVAASGAWQKAQELDQEHHILQRGRNAIVVGWLALSNFVRQHNLIERGVQGVGNALYWIAEKISQKMEEEQQRRRQPQQEQGYVARSTVVPTQQPISQKS